MSTIDDADSSVLTPRAQDTAQDPLTFDRVRTPRACERCRFRKVKCSGQQPCKSCQHHGCICIYDDIRRRRKRKAPFISVPPPAIRQKVTEAVLGENSEHTNPRPTPLQHNSLTDPAHYQMQLELRAGIGVSNAATGSFQFYGKGSLESLACPSSHYCFVQRVYQKIKRGNRERLLTNRKSHVPEGLKKWGLERYMFSMGLQGSLSSDEGAWLSQEIGDSFIQAYFRIVHPQVPILLYSEVMDYWQKLREPPVPGKPLKGKQVLLMVFAIGARVLHSEKRRSTEWVERWSNYFSSEANDLSSLFGEPSILGTHFLLLKAMYSLQLTRPNDAYLYLGHAARQTLALGLNRHQVVSGNNLAEHRLRLTFWNIFYLERMVALFTGRPSCFREDQIDAPYPDDLLALETSTVPLGHFDSIRECAYTRAMSEVGKVADRILTEIYSPKSLKSVADILRVEVITAECDTQLSSIMQSLPLFLQFFNRDAPIGADWQEVQRAHLGMTYYLARLMAHRPALVMDSMFASDAEVQVGTAMAKKIQEYTAISMSSAKAMIQIAHDVFFQRFPDIKYDGMAVGYLVSGCVTLLYDVLGPRTTPEHAKEVFTSVESGIRCLDQMEHVGPTTGKIVSMDIMKAAKDALASSASESNLDHDLMGYFPWLQSSFDNTPIDDLLKTTTDNTNNLFPQSTTTPTTGQFHPWSMANQTAAIVTNAANGLMTNTPTAASAAASSEMNYTSHWIDDGFQFGDMPDMPDFPT